MSKLLSLIAFIALPALAETPVLYGTPVSVGEVRLSPSADHRWTEIYAKITYKGACAAPSDLVVIRNSDTDFTVLAAKSAEDGLHCQAISLETQEILLGGVLDVTNVSDVHVRTIEMK